jgi:hypothetical protein
VGQCAQAYDRNRDLGPTRARRRSRRSGDRGPGNRVLHAPRRAGLAQRVAPHGWRRRVPASLLAARFRTSLPGRSQSPRDRRRTRAGPLVAVAPGSATRRRARGRLDCRPNRSGAAIVASNGERLGVTRWASVRNRGGGRDEWPAPRSAHVRTGAHDFDPPPQGFGGHAEAREGWASAPGARRSAARPRRRGPLRPALQSPAGTSLGRGHETDPLLRGRVANTSARRARVHLLPHLGQIGVAQLRREMFQPAHHLSCLEVRGGARRVNEAGGHEPALLVVDE